MSIRIYRKQNVFEAALERVRWIFDEFDNVVVSSSGGKDSTAVLNLALIVAREKGRLPLKVVFLDQEAEWQAAVDYMRGVLSSPEIEPHWLQFPFKISNSTSDRSDWLMCWDPEAEADWIREKEPNSIKENPTSTDRFKDIFGKYLKHLFPGEKACYLGGVRGEESPTRMTGLCHQLTYHAATWGKAFDKKVGHYTFYPIYDWSYTDVWKAILDNGWPYTKVYDYQFQYGVNIRDMRVSNLHHETAIRVLYYLQEAEPETWVKLENRLDGINTAGQLHDDAFVVRELPRAFRDWREYRDYLVRHLISGEEKQAIYLDRFAKNDDFYSRCTKKEKVHKVEVNTILSGDWEFTKLGNLQHSMEFNVYKKLRAGKPVSPKNMQRYGGIYE